MSNCFSLPSAEPFFNLLTASEREEARRRKEREMKGRKEESVEINETVSEFFCCYYLAVAQG